MSIRQAGTVVAALLGLHTPIALAAQSAPVRKTEVYALRYGTLPNFRVSSLVAGADTSRRMDIALMIWLVRRPDGRNVLVDAGFYRDKFVARWKPTDYRKPSDAVRAAGLRPEDITDIIVSHVHWDHVDGVDLFPNARVWLQRAEYEHHVDSAGRVRDRAIGSVDAAMLAGLMKAGRVQLIDGDARKVLPGLTVYTGGRHTFASQYVGVETADGRIILASDNAYLYENLATRTPIAQTLDSASNRQAQERMFRLAAKPALIVPGHDPAVFTRFPLEGEGVAHIRHICLDCNVGRGLNRPPAFILKDSAYHVLAMLPGDTAAPKGLAAEVLGNLNPDEIAEMEAIKPAAAIEVLGKGFENGIIIITLNPAGTKAWYQRAARSRP